MQESIREWVIEGYISAPPPLVGNPEVYQIPKGGVLLGGDQHIAYYNRILAAKNRTQVSEKAKIDAIASRIQSLVPKDRVLQHLLKAHLVSLIQSEF